MTLVRLSGICHCLGGMFNCPASTCWLISCALAHFDVQYDNCSPFYKLSCGWVWLFVGFLLGFALLKELCRVVVEEETVSFDVSALFTSIPVPVALQVINSKISTCTSFTNVCKIPTEKFIKLLEFTITNCIFCFNKKFYK